MAGSDSIASRMARWVLLVSRPNQEEWIVLLILLIILLLLAFGGGGWGYSRYGYASWSPAGLLVLILIVLLLTGGLHI